MWIRAGNVVAGLLAMLALAGLSALQSTGQQPAPQPAPLTPVSPSSFANTGRPPGDAFLMDFSRGYQPEIHYRSDFEVDNDWSLTIFRADNVRFDERGMTLAAERNSGREMPYTMSELQRVGFYGFGRYEVVMRSSSETGVITAFFTHTGEYFGDPHAEVDFEFLGRSPRTVHLNHYSGGGKNDPANVDLWFDASQDLHLYAFEWLPDSIAWFVDGVKVREVNALTSPVPIPTASSRVIASILVGNREAEEWIGTPTFDSAQALYSCISHVPTGMVGPQCSDKFTPPKP